MKVANQILFKTLSFLFAALLLLCPSGIARVTAADDRETSASSDQWTTPLDTGSDGFLRALDAITGKPPEEQIRRLLLGVNKVERVGDTIKLTREDGATLVLDESSPTGRKLLDGLNSATKKSVHKFGKPVGQLISGLSAVEIDGDRISIIRSGPSVIPIEAAQKQDKKYWVRELHLSDLSFELGRKGGRPSITNATGVSVALQALPLTIEFREFSRFLNKQGLNVYSVGIRNPLPKQLLGIFGLGDILHFKFTEKGDTPDKQIETDDSELEQASKSQDQTGKPQDSNKTQDLSKTQDPNKVQDPTTSQTE